MLAFCDNFWMFRTILFKTNGTDILFFGDRSRSIAFRLGMIEFPWRASEQRAVLELTIQFPNNFQCWWSFKTASTFCFFKRVEIFRLWTFQSCIIRERCWRGSVSVRYRQIQVQIMSCTEEHGRWATMNFGWLTLLHRQRAIVVCWSSIRVRFSGRTAAASHSLMTSLIQPSSD